MTNEMLAQLIQQGDNDELIPLLWEKTYKFIYSNCDSIYNLNVQRFAACGVERWDLKQEAYTAFLAAIKAYNVDKGYKFLTYIPLHLKGAVRRLITSDVLNTSSSLDEPIETLDGEMSLAEVIADVDSAQPFEDVETADLYRELHAIVDELPERESKVINDNYFSGKSLSDTAEEMNVSTERVRQIKVSALRELRRSKNIRRLSDITPYRHKTLSAFKTTHTSEVEDYVEKISPYPLVKRQKD